MMLPRANVLLGEDVERGAVRSRGEGVSPAELTRRFYYDGLVLDRRALRFLIELSATARCSSGRTSRRCRARIRAARTLRSLDLAPDVLEDITWHNTFRFLGIDAPELARGRASSTTTGVTQ